MKTIRWHRVTRLFLPCLLIPLAALSSVSADVDLAAVHEWDIVTAKGPPIPENYASTELQDHFGRATGIRIPIVDEVEGPDWHIYVGERDSISA